LRSNAAIAAHVALLTWDEKDPKRTDWPLVAQAADSLGRIGDASSSAVPAARAAPAALMTLIKAAPDALSALPLGAQRNAMSSALANAMTAAGRLRDKPALAEAMRVLELGAEGSPAELRAAAAFAVGMLDPTGGNNSAGMLFDIYASEKESPATKFEAIKAVGNLRHAPSAGKLKAIMEAQPDAKLRWVAHWAYERCSGTTTPYVPPSERREPPVSITDLSK
jgi:hypothetical protein